MQWDGADKTWVWNGEDWVEHPLPFNQVREAIPLEKFAEAERRLMQILMEQSRKIAELAASGMVPSTPPSTGHPGLVECDGDGLPAAPHFWTPLRS